LKYYRGELAGCTDTHPQEIEKLVEEIDIHMLQLVTGKKGGSVAEQFEAAALAYEEEFVDEDDEGIESSDDDYEDYEDEEEDEEDFDFEEELGLDSSDDDYA